ncbi:LysR family transcriptional regulator [Photobacterium sagamiensis]|uniref:LysR family transcriptional regulator n=1 Tax=Photobacterium sagamiensis TaxID=2910241 RepID=UPI003D0E3269
MKTEDLKLFHQIVEAGSMGRASEILDLPKSSISRRLKGLEEELNMLLFHRQNRALLLTEAGSNLYEKTKPALNQLELSIQEVTAPRQEITGHLRIQVLPLPNILTVGSTIFRFMDLHPKLTVEVISSTEDKSLVENYIDVAFRIAEKIDEPNLVARPFNSYKLNLYASTRYIEKHGLPKDLADLKNHNVIRFRFPDGHILGQLPIGKQPEMVEVSGKLIINSMALILEACLLGRGIVYIPEQMAKHYVERGDLVRLFDDIDPFVGRGWLVYQSRANLTLAARAFVDFALAEIDANADFCASDPEDLNMLWV